MFTNMGTSTAVAIEGGVVNSVHLTWDNLDYEIPLGDKGQTRKLLRGVSGDVRPGQMVALMGSSGAGKTTLLNVLAGRVANGTIQGSILTNGEYRIESSWKSTVAFVEQDDLMLSNLTVRETLSYAARFRLPGTMSPKAKSERIDQVIAQLGLSKCADTQIGSVDGPRGISGGERKRVSIGIELVSDPCLLFLDEPTSGLDAFTAGSVLATMKKVAVAKKKSILCTIHQPRTEILQLFDSIILLSAGKVVFTGPVGDAIKHFESVGLPNPPLTNPSDFWLDSITPDFSSDELHDASLKRIQMLQDTWQERTAGEGKAVAKLIQNAPPPRLDQRLGKFSNSALGELQILLERDLSQEILRNTPAIAAIVGQSVVQIVIFGSVFWQLSLQSSGVSNRTGFLFIVVMNQFFGVIMPIIGRFPSDKALIRRERSSGTFRAETAFISKVVTSIIQPLIANTISSSILYWMVGLNAASSRFFIHIGIGFLNVICASFVGLAIGSAVPTAFVGQTIAPLIMLIMVLYTGQLMNVSTISPVIRWIKFLSLVRYSYSSLIQNEMRGLVFDCRPPGCYPTGEDVLRAFDLEEYSVGINCVFLGCLAAGVFAVGFAFFSAKTRPSLKLR